MKLLRYFALISVISAFATPCFAIGGRTRGVSLGGQSSLGFGVGLVTSKQDHMNTLIDAANSSSGNVKNLNSGLEYFAQYAIRWDGSWWGLVFRPSMLTQSESGTCQSGHCSYELNGLAIFPMIRMVPLENDFLKLFFQVGVGYGQMDGKISQPAGSVKFKGSAFGTIAGLGVDFCITESHCITVEGNLRYLPIERNLVSSGSATGLSGLTGGAGSGDEIEANGKDLGTTMSGLQGMVSYTLLF